MKIASVQALEYIVKTAQRLHRGVSYGQTDMADQVLRTAQLVYDEEQDLRATKAALLHKSWEQKRIAPGQSVLTHGQLAALAGDDVAAIVAELRTEPDDDDTVSKVANWDIKTAWAKKLSREAQTILLAEKLINFETSRDTPNPKKPPAWHQEYIATRMIMVDGIGSSAPKLYAQIRETAQAALIKIEALQNPPADPAQPHHPSPV